MNQKRKIVFVMNGLSPYRMNLFSSIKSLLDKSNLDLTVISLCENEDNRPWRYSEYKTEYTKKSFGFTLKISDIYLHFNFGLIRMIKKENPSIIIIAGGYHIPSNLMLVIKKYKLGAPIYFWSESHLNEVRNYNKYTLKSREYLRKFFYSKMDGFLSPGIMADDLIRKYNNSSLIIRLPNTIEDQNYFYKRSIELNKKRTVLRENYSITKDKIVLFSAARLHKSKGLELFLNLINKSKHKSRIVYVLAGTGSLEPTLECYAIKNQIDLRLIGYINIQTLTEFLAFSDYFVLPSISDPSPLSVIEAIWSGKALLLSNIVGNSIDVMDYGINGVSFDIFNESSINLIDNYIEDSLDKLDEISEQSYIIASNRFDAELIHKNLVTELIKITEANT